MNTVRDLHNQAMALAQRAFLAREAEHGADAARLASEALAFEREAAGRLDKTPTSEPTRSILYRSAATLARQAGDLAQAQRLVAEGLAGYPPPRVEQELKDLLEEIGAASYVAIPDGPDETVSSSEVTFRGVLDEATVRRSDEIGFTTTENQQITVLVHEGVDDLVRSYFNRPVEVRVRYQGSERELVSVTPIEEER